MKCEIQTGEWDGKCEMTVTACTLVINLFRTYYEDVMGEPLDGRKLPRAKKKL